jgi:hypothetical protein
MSVSPGLAVTLVVIAVSVLGDLRKDARTFARTRASLYPESAIEGSPGSSGRPCDRCRTAPDPGSQLRRAAGGVAMSRVLQALSRGTDQILTCRSAPGDAGDYGRHLIPGLAVVRFRDCAGLSLPLRPPAARCPGRGRPGRSHGGTGRKTPVPRARSRVPMTTTARSPGARASAASAPGPGTRVNAGSRHLRRLAGGLQCCR